MTIKEFNEKILNTAALMESDNYKDRFLAEYWQTKVRLDRLKKFNINIQLEEEYSIGRVNHDCPYRLLRKQEAVMEEYLEILEMRAIIENISLAGDEDERS